MGSFIEYPVIITHVVLGALCLVAWGVTSGIASASHAGEVLTGRTARYTSNAVLYTAVFVGLLVVANIAVVNNDKRWDLTEQGVYSLSEKSVNILKGLKKPLTIIAVESPSIPGNLKTKELLGLYRYNNEKLVTVKFIDPRAKPVEMDTLGMKSGNMLYLKYGEDTDAPISRINTTDEQSVTNAILKLTRGAAKKFYYLQGHAEPSLESAERGGMKEFASALEDEHVKVEGLLLSVTGKVPEDAAAVMVAAPKRPLSQQERDALISYAEQGGRLVLLANPEDRGNTEIATLASKFGIEVDNDIVIDQQLRLFGSPELAVEFFTQTFSPHPIVSRLGKSDPPFFAIASSVRSAGKGDATTTYTDLLKTGPSSWGEKSIDELFAAEGGTASLDPSDLKGPLSIAVAYEKKLNDAGKAQAEGEKFEKSTRVVVFGDANWLQNGVLSSFGNRSLALNVVNWTVGEEGGVAIGPKSLRASSFSLQEKTFNKILAFSFFGPEMILLVGLFIWWRRRVALA